MQTNVRFMFEPPSAAPQGQIVLHAEFFHNPVSQKILASMPFQTYTQLWGDEIYFDIGIDAPSESATTDVQSGETVERGKIIGHTGVTGLAGGDHLHFSMIIQHTFVDPIEWWDAAWIKNNITDKISSIKSTLGGE